MIFAFVFFATNVNAGIIYVDQLAEDKLYCQEKEEVTERYLATGATFANTMGAATK